MIKKFISIGFIILLAFTNYTQAQVKQVNDFKQIKKAIDTLWIFTPVVFVENRTVKKTSLDTDLGKTISSEIGDKIYTTLKNKYSILDVQYKLDSNYYRQATAFFLKLDSLNKVLGDIEIPEWLNKDFTQGKYIFAVFFGGFYNPNVRPDYMVGGYSAGNTDGLTINTKAEQRMDIKLLITDRNNNRILYYKSLGYKHFDPRLRENVETATSDLIKQIYYK